MSQYVETHCEAFPVSAAIGQYLRVTLNTSGQLVVAGAGDWASEIGTTEEATFAAGVPVACRLRTAMGTRKMVAAGAISIGVPVYPAASGKVTATSGTEPQIGICGKTAATANGDVIEVIYQPPANMNFINLQDVAALTPAQGDLPFITAGGALAMLAPGTSGQQPTSQGTGADLHYAAA